MSDRRARNSYDILDITHDASEADIKKAFRRIANECHPDKTSHLPKDHRKKLEEMFIEAKAAYKLLSDEAKKSAYVGTPSGRKKPEPASQNDDQASTNKRQDRTKSRPAAGASLFLSGIAALFAGAVAIFAVHQYSFTRESELNERNRLVAEKSVEQQWQYTADAVLRRPETGKETSFCSQYAEEFPWNWGQETQSSAFACVTMNPFGQTADGRVLVHVLEIYRRNYNRQDGVDLSDRQYDMMLWYGNRDAKGGNRIMRKSMEPS